MDEKKLQRAKAKFEKQQKAKKRAQEEPEPSKKDEGPEQKDFRKFLGCGG